MYALLAKFEVGIAEEEQGMIGSLHQSGDDFAAVLEESEASLNKAKVAMKRDLESAISTYNERCARNASNFISPLICISNNLPPLSNSLPPRPPQCDGAA
jgi:hypothetical protein